MQFNNISFQQALQNNDNSFSNDLNWIPALPNKNLLEFRWLFSRKYYKKSLDIFDGYVCDIKDYEGIHDNIVQWIKSPFIFSNAYASYKIPSGKVTYDIRAGVVNERQLLNTQLAFTNDSSTIIYTGDAGNHLNWGKDQFYISPGADMKWRKRSGSLRIPVIHQSINYRQGEYALNGEFKRLLVQPGLNIRYNFTPEHYISGKYNYRNDFGDITNVYKGAVLLNYRLLHANTGGLQQSKTHTATIHYDYQKSIKLFLLNADFSYGHSTADYIMSTTITENMEKTVLLPYMNRIKNIRAGFGLSKFLYRLKINTTINASYIQAMLNQLANNNLIPFQNDSYIVNAAINKRISEVISINYGSINIWSRLFTNVPSGNQAFNRNLFRTNQNLTFAITAFKNVYADITARHSYTHQSGSNAVKYLFADAGLRYSGLGKRVEFQIFANNLFNVRQYKLFSIGENQETISSFDIRGRTFQFRVECIF